MSGSFLVSSARNLVPAAGERIFFNTSGIISWTVPAGVTSISIVVVGGGGGAGGLSINYNITVYATGGGGGGGGLAYVTDIAVTPGEILEINAGQGGTGGLNLLSNVGLLIGTVATDGTSGESSWVRRQGSGTFIVLATGGGGGAAFGGLGGTGGILEIGEGGSVGGSGGNGSSPSVSGKDGAGGGGAAGYEGQGGTGYSSFNNGGSNAGSPGTGGGGAGGNSMSAFFSGGGVGSYGGGVGIYGQRLDGVPATPVSSTVQGPGGPGSAFLTGSIISIPTSLSTLTFGPYGISGLSATTALSSGSNDDGFFTFNLPWVVTFLGISYSQVFVGTNSYLTFGAGSNLYSGLSSSNPAVPKIMVSTADNSGQRVYFGTVGTSPNRRYIIRYEGTASTTGTIGSPNMVVEYQLYEISNQIDIHIISNARGQFGGFSGIYNATGSEAYTFSNGAPANQAYRFTNGGSSGGIIADTQYIYAGGGAGAQNFFLSGTYIAMPTNAPQGNSGAVRIIWPGSIRRFPDVNVMPGVDQNMFAVPGPPRLRLTGTENPTTTTIVILYDTPITGGSFITSYYATQLPSGPTLTLTQSGAGDFTFTGLTVGTYYNFNVYAVNPIGTGSPLQLTNIPAGTVPLTISVVSVSVASVSSLVVNWTNPTNTSGWPIISWRVRLLLLDVGVPPGTYSTTPASTVDVTLPNSGAPITTYTATSLAQGRTYDVQVLSTNVVGDGTFSNTILIAPSVIPDAPIIGTATSVNATTASVSFTAPAVNGGTVITSYTAVSSPGGITGTLSGAGSGSVTVTGLTALTTYTFTVYATNARGNSTSSGASNSVQIVAAPGQVEFTTAGNYNWTVPEGVASISIVLVGAGGTPNGYYGGGGGGGLTYKNNLSVTPGTVYPIQVARIGVSNTPEDLPPSFFNSATYLFAASGGRGTVATFGGYPGGGGGAAGYSGNGGPGIFAGAGSLFGTGGAGGGGGGTVGGQVSWSGGSGAPHYGGAFATYGNGFTGSGGAGGGGGAGGAGPGGGGAGGGVGIYGEGPSGTGGAPSGSATTAGQRGNPGSNGVGNLYGGGAGGPGSPALWQPGGGAVRIIWPGNLRVFPSTRTSNE
jgi:hypothetical protein